MIRVIRLGTPPTVLSVDGTAKSQELCVAYTNGDREFSFDSAIYGHAEVKNALVEMHHGKCCYCESFVKHNSPGTVDHFRPKGASQQAVGQSYIRPGYYWLAYEWTNLLFSCQICNQECKRNQFPLSDNSKRALSHLHDIGQEEPLLIDPSVETRPEDLISFHDEYAFAVDDNARGLATIAVLKLNDRPDLLDVRRNKIKVLQLIRSIIELLPDQPEAADARQFLSEAALDTAEYAAMCRAYLH